MGRNILLCAWSDLADVELRALALVRVAEAETLDALFQSRGLGVEVSRGAGTATLRPRGPRPRRDQRSGPRGRRGVGVVHDEDGVLERDCDTTVASHLAVMLATFWRWFNRFGTANAAGVFCVMCSTG